MHRQRTQEAWGCTTHRGWAHLFLGRAWDLIIHGPAHRGANGAAMPTDEDDQDDHFFFKQSEGGGATLPPRCAQALLLCLDQIPPTEGGGGVQLSLLLDGPCEGEKHSSENSTSAMCTVTRCLARALTPRSSGCCNAARAHKRFLGEC